MKRTVHLRAVAPRPDWTPASTGVALLTQTLREPRKILGYGACYLIYGVKRLWVRDHIVVTPDRPHRVYFLWKMAMLSGYRMIGVAAASRSPSRRPALAHFLHSDVTREALHDPRLVNGACNDISKTHVDRVFRRVFGYSIMLDPTRHQGVAVRKSDENAAHDGQIVQCPVAPDEVQPTMVYQKLIDNSVGSDLVKELRVGVIGSDLTDVVIKQRTIRSRFLGFGDGKGKTLESVDAVFTAAEVAKIRQFNREIGLEFGELDILRDNSDSRIYIIDANKTASFLCGPRSFRFDRLMLAWRRARHFRRFLRQRAEGWNGSIPAHHAVLSRLRRLPELALTPIGRHKVRRHLRKYTAWPLLWPAVLAYRRTFMSGTRILTVVGSVGKTTTTAAACTALGLAPPRLHRNSWGSLALAALAIRPGQRHAVLEVGIDEPGQMVRYAGILRPDMVVVTAIASEHGRSLGSLDNIRDEKAHILRGLRPGGLVVLNGDDPRVRSMAASTDARVLTFGFGADNDVRASEPRLDWPYGTQLEVEIGGRTLQLRVRLLGRVTMYAVLAALTVAWAEGRPLDEVVRALEALPPRQGRMEPIRLPDGFWLIRDDFKSTLETIHAALDLLAEVPARRIAVLGDISGRLQRVGHEAGPRYQLLGERLSTVVSRAVIIAGKESFDRYAAGASAAGQSGAELVHVRGVKAATEAVRADLRPGDVILIKGRQQQRLSRIALALQGRKVGCEIEECDLKDMRCETCPMLERGWVSPEGSNPRR